MGINFDFVYDFFKTIFANKNLFENNSSPKVFAVGVLNKFYESLDSHSKKEFVKDLVDRFSEPVPYDFLMPLLFERLTHVMVGLDRVKDDFRDALLNGLVNSDRSGFLVRTAWFADGGNCEESTVRWIIASYNRGSLGPKIKELYGDILKAFLLKTNELSVKTKTLKVLLETDLRLFWELSEYLRVTKKELWMNCIVSVLSGDPHITAPLSDNEGVHRSAQQIVQLLTRKYVEEPEIHTAVALRNILDLTTHSPRQMLIEEWKSFETNEVEYENLVKFSRWFDDELPDRKIYGSVEVVSKNFSEQSESSKPGS